MWYNLTSSMILWTLELTLPMHSSLLLLTNELVLLLLLLLMDFGFSYSLSSSLSSSGAISFLTLTTLFVVVLFLFFTTFSLLDTLLSCKLDP